MINRVGTSLDSPSSLGLWPSLPLEAWKETYATLHMWTQAVGKIPLKLSPYLNHWWEVAFHVSSRGLTTELIPYGNRAFEIQFDFIDHDLTIHTTDGLTRRMSLSPRSVAAFYQELMELVRSVGLQIQIDPMPKEVMNPIPFDQDQTHHSYDREYAYRFWKILVQSDRLMKKFRSEFVGKSSPVHFFWGSFDLAASRFSGRLAPPRKQADSITALAYSHEVISCGFWPGSGNIRDAAYYAYAAPEPAGFSTTKIQPAAGFYNPPSKGFVLMYEHVRQAKDPDQMVLDFFQSTYEAAANLAHWDRDVLERHRLKLKSA